MSAPLHPTDGGDAVGLADIAKFGYLTAAGVPEIDATTGPDSQEVL